ncbi:MAG: CMP-2-keto-3-deoxyoctulosonic acid synthetase [Eggerthellaceae bacterium]|nr:CMP-2-keto-3-deoxyoctulosonic acid synthetase [Eggerthellaceae bacterium]
MSRKQPKRTAGKMVKTAIAGFFIFAIVGSVGLGVASADPDDELARAGAFGFDSTTNESTLTSRATNAATTTDSSSGVVREQSMLVSTSQRNVDSGLKMIDAKEKAEQERIAADNIAVFERVESKKAMQGVASTPAPTADVVADVQPEAVEKQAEPVETDVQEEPLMEYNLPAIDWSVGREAFVAEWSARIDAYLAGSPLSGYGTTFAEAAWENGIDPRWSPAISNTESGKGSVCFLPHNAWGWGSSAWGDWDTAIRAHVAGLASGYGYSLTPEGAAMYCPPHAADWYNKTLAQMASI